MKKMTGVKYERKTLITGFSICRQYTCFSFYMKKQKPLFKTESKALNHVLKHLFMVTIINA